MSTAEYKLTVAVPAYNAERYLERCLDSLVSQNFDGLEILIIDDCSTDSTAAICERYASRNKNIRVIRHEVNRGLGMARHTAIMNTDSEFMLFIDSDDYFLPDAVGKLYGAADDDTELVVGQHEKYSLDGSEPKQRIFPDGQFILTDGKNDSKSDDNGTAQVDRVFVTVDSVFGVEAWNKLYRTRILRKISEVENSVRFAEDIFTTLLYYSHMTGKIRCIPDVTYMYEYRSDSLARSSEKLLVLPRFAEQLIKIRHLASEKNAYISHMFPYLFYYVMSIILVNYARGDDASKSHTIADIAVLHDNAEVRSIAEDYFNSGIRREKQRIIPDRQRRAEIDCFYKAVLTGDAWYYTRLLPAKLEKKRTQYVIKAWIKRILKIRQ